MNFDLMPCNAGCKCENLLSSPCTYWISGSFHNISSFNHFLLPRGVLYKQNVQWPINTFYKFSTTFLWVSHLKDKSEIKNDENQQHNAVVKQSMEQQINVYLHTWLSPLLWSNSNQSHMPSDTVTLIKAGFPRWARWLMAHPNICHTNKQNNTKSFIL